MTLTLAMIAGAIIVRSLLARVLDRWLAGPATAMLVMGALAALLTSGSTVEALNTTVAQHVVEVVLALLLFSDATMVRGGRLFGSHPRLLARVLLLAMPLSIGLTVAVGVPLLGGAEAQGGLTWPVLLVIACIVVPTDFAAAERLLKHTRLSSRVRTTLNLESGYNDALISPLFLFAIALAVGPRGQEDPLGGLATALPYALKALVVGVVVGAALAGGLHAAAARGWVDASARRMLVLMAPLLTYAVTLAWNGNGFVASFVAGAVFANVHRVVAALAARTRPDGERQQLLLTREEDFRFLHDVTGLAVMAVWFLVGSACVLAFAGGVPWPVLLFTLVALTLVRLLPVWVGTAGSGVPGRERVLLGVLGARGTTSIVFGLLAYNSLTGAVADTVLLITVLTLLGSVLLHGPLANPLIQRLTRAPRPASPAASEAAIQDGPSQDPRH
ncbi:NhaP-type Na+/H+ or K+/H+ antiporter [Kineococcus radiotolerans]|uniref:NhaP-type Na+/H+ or K+/H+ antiporter n=1 Tax=Kineococcus radiotolerans TaxID=131568 RepID=A0A7W4TQK8_KINRA|nr:cation:proton antiporter [Kineococcus radiotolerans]MBB2903130.1 NhaP-type Na+/H+ or K+/H+ antiporter [Kineococcus radiotolerans]